MQDISEIFQLHIPESPEIIVFSEYTSNRLIYVLDFICKRVWQKNYIITQDIETFKHSDKIKINYSDRFIENAVNVYPLNLLNGTGIDKNYHLHFEVLQPQYYHKDIFSEVFYFISRYEEWQNNYTKDTHQRFEINASIFKDQLNQPITDIAIADFKQYIQKHYPSFEPKLFYKEILTFDLDNILAFKGKGWIRSIAALLKHLLKAEYRFLNERIKTLLQNKPDPLEEVYISIEQLSQKYPIIFFILCRSDTSFDRAASVNHPQTMRVLNQLKNFAHIGLHPSYYSMHDIDIIQKEKSSLENVIHQKIVASRQHYLRTDIARTPKLLIQSGIQYDFTMGFASARGGFRAGTAFPFYYYDFDAEQITRLLFVPFCVMDGAYFNYSQTSIKDATESIRYIKKQIQQTGGYFIPLFHEMTLCPLFQIDAEEWRSVLG
ncbi:MAG: hypothetical protein Fur0023_03130 [Bacteroidia bacterium]